MAAPQLLVRAAAAIGYLAAVHAAILTHRPVLALGGLAAASGVNVATGLVRHHARGIVLFWSILCAATVSLAIASALGRTEAVQILLLPSVIVNLAAALFFARSLLPGSDPLITQVIRVETPDVDCEKAAYARALTAVWAGFFIFMTIAAVGLALWADLATWSWFANVVNPVTAALLFFGEHIVRPRRFGGPASPFRTIRLTLQAPIWNASPR